MPIKEFVESFNKGIADNLQHTYEFPGKSLENKKETLIDEYNLLERAIMIEIKRPGHSWIFNLDYKDEHRFYKPTNDDEFMRIPYMSDLDDKESFFDHNFSYNLYW